MTDSVRWRQDWEVKSGREISDFELDRGTSPSQQETERLSEQELLAFIEPADSDVLLDAGCGTGVNILRLHARVRKIIAMDYARGSIERCRKRIAAQKITNTTIYMGSVAAIPLPDSSVNRILCLSVLQYLDDEEVRKAFREFVRVLTPGGVIILHVKNSSSLYWSTLRVAKKLKTFLGGSTQLYFLRPFQWYVDELESVDCRILDYNSFNSFVLEGMPQRLRSFIQRLELRHRNALPFRTAFLRRHGPELKIKSRALNGLPGTDSRETRPKPIPADGPAA